MEIIACFVVLVYLAWPDKQKQFSNPEVSIAVKDVLLTERDSTVH